MENGDIPWKKMIGDYLLQRLGVPTEYFEVMADARELNGWRDREDICLIIFEQPQKAQQLLETYQKKYRKKTPFEEQFLRKMQTILLMQAYKKSFESKSVDVEREKSEGGKSGGKRTADGTMYITRWMGKKEAVKVFTGSL